MKVLFLRTDYYGHINVGGSFSHTAGFLNGLKALGHEPIILSSGALPLTGPVRVHEVPYSRLYRNLPEVLSLAYNYTLISKANTIISQERPDVLYHRHSEFNFASSILARKHRVPLVLEFNGSELWVKRNWGRLYLEGLLAKTERVQLQGASVITVVSAVLRDELIRQGIHPQRVLVNPNGVDPDIFTPDIDGSDIRRRYGLTKKLVAGFVGTFGPWHGVETLAKAVLPAVKKNPNVHFLIIGDGMLRGSMEQILRNNGVMQSVTMTGSIPHEEIPRHLAACDILLSPHVQNTDGSEFFGSPTKLFEYMASGRPIVASAVGQIRDVLKDGINAIYMKANDHADLAEKIFMLAGKPGLRESLGRQARLDAVNLYSWRRNAERVIDAVTPFTQRK